MSRPCKSRPVKPGFRRWLRHIIAVAETGRAVRRWRGRKFVTKHTPEDFDV